MLPRHFKKCSFGSAVTALVCQKNWSRNLVLVAVNLKIYCQCVVDMQCQCWLYANAAVLVCRADEPSRAPWSRSVNQRSPVSSQHFMEWQRSSDKWAHHMWQADFVGLISATSVVPLWSFRTVPVWKRRQPSQSESPGCSHGSAPWMQCAQGQLGQHESVWVELCSDSSLVLNSPYCCCCLMSSSSGWTRVCCQRNQL